MTHPVYRGLIDSDTLLGRFCLSAPQRFGRHKALFDVPYARVDSVLNGMYSYERASAASGASSFEFNPRPAGGGPKGPPVVFRK